MLKSIRDYTSLNNQVEMPWLGFGVFMMEEGVETENAVSTALEVGYRSIDTAAIYKNEVGVGKAIARSGIPRQEIFLTTKVWNSDQGYQSTLKAFEESRKKLKVDYVDLYLIHWPVKGRYVDTWKALEKLYRDGSVRVIGLSNFLIHHMEDILAICEITPAVNQVELHPELRMEALHKFCIANRIQLEGYAPLGQGQSLTVPLIVEMAKKYYKTPAQILIRWALQHRIVTIPKSSHPDRIKENSKVFDFILSDEDMICIDQLDANRRVGADPDNFDF